MYEDIEQGPNRGGRRAGDVAVPDAAQLASRRQGTPGPGSSARPSPAKQPFGSAPAVSKSARADSREAMLRDERQVCL